MKLRFLLTLLTQVGILSPHSLSCAHSNQTRTAHTSRCVRLVYRYARVSTNGGMRSIFLFQPCLCHRCLNVGIIRNVSMLFILSSCFASVFCSAVGLIVMMMTDR